MRATLETNDFMLALPLEVQERCISAKLVVKINENPFFPLILCKPRFLQWF
jgi:hypothetical protein